MTNDLITRWVLTLDEHDVVVLKRKLVPKNNPMNYLIEEDGNYTYSTFVLYGINFSVVFKEEESHDSVKSIIYIGKIDFIDGKQVVLDLNEEDEAYIEIIANIFLREDKTQMH